MLAWLGTVVDLNYRRRSLAEKLHFAGPHLHRHC
jgi:hypothetical protein